MAGFADNYLKLAVQKEGRLTEETLAFLRSAGLEFESYKKRLFSRCQNFPLEILYVRDDDIPDYIVSGTVDLGIIGQNLLNELRPKVKKLLNLRYGFCSLAVAVPKELNIGEISELKNKIIATAYPNSTRYFFANRNIPVKLIKISGSVEVAPALGISSGIVDLISTGSTLALNDLKVIAKIYESEAVLIVNKKTEKEKRKKILIDKLLIRFRGVLSARKYKYIMMNAPKKILPRLKKIIPGWQVLIFSSLLKEDWVSVQSIIKEDIFWETIDRLKRIGISGITIMPIEKIII